MSAEWYKEQPTNRNFLNPIGYLLKLEKFEGIELLRALEIGLKIKSPTLSGDSFAVEVKRDYIKAKNYIRKDKFYKFYK